MSNQPQNLGPVKQPPPEHAVVSAEMAELMGSSVRKGDTVLYVYQPGEEWASIVVELKENNRLDLVTFRPDGNTVRYWDVPAQNEKIMGNCWKARP